VRPGITHPYYFDDSAGQIVPRFETSPKDRQ
jgi:hypothetical protein